MLAPYDADAYQRGSMSVSPEKPASGLPHALTAYLIWGLLPLYVAFLPHVPALEFVGWRAIFTIPICLLAVAISRQSDQLLAAVRNPRTLAVLCATALLIGCNWVVYILAIQEGHVLAASLGYYINPLVNVLAGTLFLGEKLTGKQWTAVALAAAGVSLLAWDARDMLGISLTLAISFSSYGLLRKMVPVSALPGLTIESVILLLPATGLLFWQSSLNGSLAIGKDLTTDLLLAASGLITATPLLLFAIAARRMDYSTLGFIQYVAPTLVFLQGLFLFREPLKLVQLACFVVIWAAIAIFTWDLLVRRRAAIVARA